MKRRYMKPWIFGVAAGTLFVLAEVIFGIYPPAAYAFCMSCHVRDLVNALLNGVLGLRYEVTEVGGRALLLTSPGVLLGAFAAARLHRENRSRKADRPLIFTVLGFLIMTIGILIFGCPTRITLRAGYGEVYGIVALAAMLLGIALTTLLMRLRVSRGSRG